MVRSVEVDIVSLVKSWQSTNLGMEMFLITILLRFQFFDYLLHCVDLFEQYGS